MNLAAFLKAHKYSEITEEFPDKEKYPLYYETNKVEFTIRAGEKLFIPAGWFHFVFSEDVEEETGLNFAMNFWYYPLYNWSHGKSSNLLPRKELHNIPNINPKDIMGDRKIRSTWADLNGLFPSDRVFHYFTGKVRNEYITFDEFYKAKNPKMYIVQDQTKELEIYAPPYPTDIYLSSGWVNFGNCRSLIHCDEHDNWLCQIKGSKRVILFPHEDKDKLYMFTRIPMQVYTEIEELVNVRDELIIIKNYGHLDENINLLDFYRDCLTEYNNLKLSKFKTVLPEFTPPKCIISTDTNNQRYQQPQPYPINFFYVKRGKGTITFPGRGANTLDSGYVIMFPSSFIFPFLIEGNLKLCIPL